MKGRFLAGLGLLLAPLAVFAAAVDVTGVTDDIALQAAPVAAIGAAVLLLLVAIKAFKWVRRAMSILLPVGAVSLGMPGTSEAAAVVVTSVTADIAAQAAPVAAIGAAVLLLLVAIKAFKWVRRAMSILLPVGAGSFLMTDQASAAAVDVGAVVTDVGAQAAPVAAIGAAVLLLLVAIKAFKWVRRAM
jgi:DMSO/TMAO reductase YedYZ heme-binding membrane subunit